MIRCVTEYFWGQWLPPDSLEFISKGHLTVQCFHFFVFLSGLKRRVRMLIGKIFLHKITFLPLTNFLLMLAMIVRNLFVSLIIIGEIHDQNSFD